MQTLQNQVRDQPLYTGQPGIMARRARFIALVAIAIIAMGCKSYQLRGKVIAGPASTAEIVAANDPRLDDAGIGGASIEIVIDPDKLSRKTGGTTTSDYSGDFRIPITEPGAGFLEYEVRAIVRLPGYAPAVRLFQLPSAGKRLLILLSPGPDRYMPEKSDILEETLQMSKPYLNE